MNLLLTKTKPSPFTLRAFVIGAILSAVIGIAEPFGIMWIAGSLLTSSGGAAIAILFILILIVNTC